MAIYAEYPLRSSGILQVREFLLAIAALEAWTTVSLIVGNECLIFNLNTARRTTIRAVVANN